MNIFLGETPLPTVPSNYKPFIDRPIVRYSMVGLLTMALGFVAGRYTRR